MTESGKYCLFPFYHNNHVYIDSCVRKSPSSKPWCAIQVNNDKTIKEKSNCVYGDKEPPFVFSFAQVPAQ